MKVFFYSTDSNLNKVSYQSDATVNGNIIQFVDHSVSNTSITLEIKEQHLLFKREGDVRMDLEFKEGQVFPSKYKNEMGLEFEFEVFCQKLQIQKNRIDIEYDMIYEKETLSHHKIWIIIR